MNAFYTQTGVYLPLAAKLPAIKPDQIIGARFSKSGDEKGAAGQRDATFKTFGNDPDVAKLSLIPDAAWDPKRADIGQQYGITWIYLSDLHDSLDRQTPCGGSRSSGENSVPEPDVVGNRIPHPPR